MEDLLAETFGNITWVETIDLTLFFHYNHIDKEAVSA